MIDRIVTINDSSIPKGGATLLAVTASTELRRRGHRVTFLTGDKGDNPAMAAAGVEVAALGAVVARDSARSQAFIQALYNRRAAGFLRDWIAANDTPGTVYHLHNWGQILSPSIFSALSTVQDRLVISAHDFFHVCPNGSFTFLRSGKVCGFVPMSPSCILANCDRRNYGYKLWRVARQAIRNALFDTGAPVPILAIHERMRPFLVRAGVPDAAVRTLPNPITPFRPRRIEAESNREFVYVGRMELNKGPDIAARAARAAGVAMRFIGDGSCRAELQAAFPEHRFDGFVERARIGPILDEARAVVMPSRTAEPYGLVAMEALWSGLPVLLAETAFLAPDIVEVGAGLSFSVADEPGLADLFRYLAADDAAVAAMSEAAISRTAAFGLTPESWLDRLEEAYRERLSLAAQAGPRRAA